MFFNLSPCLETGTSLALCNWSGTMPFHDLLIISYTILATKSVVSTATKGSIPSGPTERVCFTVSEMLIILLGEVGDKANEFLSGSPK